MEAAISLLVCTTSRMDTYDCELMIRILTRRRQKITQRGRLTPSEEYVLNMIDAEIEYFTGVLEWLQSSD